MAEAKKENLAFYKRSGEPWTLEEVNKIILNCDSKSSGMVSGNTLDSDVATNKYIYDCGDTHNAYYGWTVQRTNDLDRCIKHDYHEYFSSTLKTYKMNI